MKETIINYDVINFLTKTLALRFKLNSRNFTHVIGIARGGLVPATIMSHMFDADLLTYNVKSYKGKRQGEFKIIQDIDLDELVLQEEEVSEVKFITFKDFKKAIYDCDDTFWIHEEGFKLLIENLEPLVF